MAYPSTTATTPSGEGGGPEQPKFHQRCRGCAFLADEEDHGSMADPARLSARAAGEARPHTDTWFSASTSRTNAGARRNAPSKLNPPSVSMAPVCGSTSHPITVATTPNGTDIQNTQCHPTVPSTTPPTAGPMLIPIACAAAKMPSAQAAAVLVHGFHQDRDAVCAQQRSADSLQDAERDERRQIGGEAAHRARDDEHDISDQIERFAAEHLAQTPEDWEEGGEGDEIGQRHPADRLHRDREGLAERRQCQLDDGGVELTDEGTDADEADDEPQMPGLAREVRQGRRFARQAPDRASQARFAACIDEPSREIQFALHMPLARFRSPFRRRCSPHLALLTRPSGNPSEL